MPATRKETYLSPPRVIILAHTRASPVVSMHHHHLAHSCAASVPPLQYCSFPIQAGCNVSRARVATFKHNDVEDLKRVIERFEKEDKEKR